MIKRKGKFIFYQIPVVVLVILTTVGRSAADGEVVPNETGDVHSSTGSTPVQNYNNQPTTPIYKSTQKYQVINYNVMGLPRCPSEYQQIDIGRTTICYYLTKPQPFPPTCPYGGYGAHFQQSEAEYLYIYFQNTSFWILATRNMTEGFGPFEWLEPKFGYRSGINYENIVGNISEKNCLLYHNQTMTPVNCMGSYPALCLLPLMKSESRICNITMEDGFNRTCVTGVLNNNKCFCKTQSIGKNPIRNDFCKNLTEPKMYETSYMYEKFNDSGTCWFGMERGNGANLVWTSSKRNVDYTFWAADADEEQKFGAIKFDESRGMVTHADGKLNCAICDTEPVFPNVSIKLKVNKITGDLELHIRNYSYLAFVNGYYGECFAEPSRYRFKTEFNLVKYSKDEEFYIERLTYFTDDYPAFYWCVVYLQPDFTPLYSNTVRARKQEIPWGHEYAIFATVNITKDMDPYYEDQEYLNSEYLSQYVNRTAFLNVVRLVRVLRFEQESSRIDVLMHLSTLQSNLTIEEEYDNLQNVLNLLSQIHANITVTGLTSSEVCLASTSTSGTQTLNWAETAIGSTVLPAELCLQANNMPVTRTCEGDFFKGGSWSAVDGTCAETLDFSTRTVALYVLLTKENKSGTNFSSTFLELSKYAQGISVSDVYFITVTLNKLKRYESIDCIQETAKILSNVMNYNRSVLEEAQIKLNSTDDLLYHLDQTSADVELSAETPYKVVKSSKLLIQVADIKTTNIIGVMVKRVSDGDTFDSFTIEPLYTNITLALLLQEDFEVATFLPELLLNEIKWNLGPEYPIKLITSVFYNDALFNDNTKIKKQALSRIISLQIPGIYNEFYTTFPLIFKKLKNSTDEEYCGHWEYGRNELMQNIRGHWVTNGKKDEMEEHLNDYTICESSHMTHFAILILDDSLIDEEYDKIEHIIALNLITLIGSILSLVGILAILITACTFERWRSQPGNVIIINYSITIAIQMILLFLVELLSTDTTMCIISGSLLHYTVLSQFCWMLVIAYLQYRRYVTVLQPNVTHLEAKACLFGWGLPLLPVLVLLILSLLDFVSFYTQSARGLCYPVQKYFYFGVCAPVLVIVCLNIVIFILIFKGVCARTIQCHGGNEKRVKLQISLAVLLFFLLGFSWIFGIIASLGASIVFSYLFCIAGTLQGFVIFYYFVLNNEQTLSLWSRWRAKYRMANNSVANNSQDASNTNESFRLASSTAQSW